MPDIRFTKISSDPRFRRPRRKKANAVLDDRFKTLFAHDRQPKQSDKYGRPIQSAHDGGSLKHLYRLEADQDIDPVAFPDYARGEVLLESSDDENDIKGGKSTFHKDEIADHNTISIPDNLQVEIDLDENNFAALDAQVAAFNAANPENTGSEAAPTRRLAAVNLDWDHVRATHLFKICSSLLSTVAPVVPSCKPSGSQEKERETSECIGKGKVVSVEIYPSEFGKERMAREEIEGPPSNIFRRKDKDGEVTAQSIYDIGDQDDYDDDALRNYQLERLRYYYAIITCDSVGAATHIYHELEGTELERSANVFDLSYVPDDMTFDETLRDQATADTGTSYKGADFVTDALRHSKVKLTWEEDDPERNQLTRRALTKEEIENGDFRAYVASSSSESESETTHSTGKIKRSKKSSRDKLRALLFDNGNDMPEGWNRDTKTHDVDLQITFTPGLNEKTEETTLDKYQRKIREKRQRKKSEIKSKISQGQHDREVVDEFFDVEGEKQDDQGSSRKRKIPSRQAIPLGQTKRPSTTAEELALVAFDDSNAQSKHFDMKSILKAEKKVHRKGKQHLDDNEVQPEFVIDVNDERFKALHEDHQFAIDPTNPHFKKTKAMDAFLKERSKRQNKTDQSRSLLMIPSENEEKDFTKLVKSVKRKSSKAFSRVDKRRKSS